MSCSNNQALRHLPFSLTGAGTLALLLDAVAQEHLLRRIYQWSDNPQVDPLYLQTPWHEQGNRTLFGPIDTVCCPDSLLSTWHCHSAPRATAPSWSEPYRLDEQQWTLLEQVAFRQAVLKLSLHMQQYFPDYQPQIQGPARGQLWQHLAEMAYRQGFCSPQEILLFANIHGFLGPAALHSYPAVNQLLQDKNLGSALQRVQLAAKEAARLASQEKIT